MVMAISCNDLRYGQAEKNGLQLPPRTGEGLSVSLQFNPEPDSLAAFLWPSEQYFNRRGGGRKLDYQGYIRQVAEEVFLGGDELDQWTLRYLTEGKDSEQKLADIEAKKAPLLAQSRQLTSQLRRLRKQRKSLEQRTRSQTRKVAAKKGEITTLQAEIDQLEQLGCSEEGLRKVPCEEWDASRQKLQAKLSLLQQNVAELRQTKVTLEGELREVQAQSTEVFAAKRAIEQGELSGLKEEEALLQQNLDTMTAHQAERIARIQTALDPHAVIFQRDDDKNILYDHNNFPQRLIDEEAQVNWVKVYQNTAGAKNSFSLGPDRIEIRLGEWNGDQAYATRYQKTEGEQWELHPESTIYDVSLVNEVLRFKFNETDSRGNLTDRIFEFTLQRTPFDRHIRLIGDMVITVGGEVVRRGQMKVILLAKER